MSDKERRFFELAFELAYWIHANKEIASFVAEDAVDRLPVVLGRQKKNRKPSEQLRGFFKWGERTRPIRKTVSLTEHQMLQWLVFKESEYWELQTELHNDPYSPSEEDLIVRYIKHLVFITLRRDPFYATLAIGSLLYQFERREARLFYDILTQSDSARMKDTNYIGKQRLELLDQVSGRFGRMIETARNPGEEKHLVLRPLTHSVIDLVRECLSRFTPWDTSCVVKPEFDVTDIPGLYFSGPSLNEDEEELIAMNRTHTVLHPKCLTLFCEGLSEYVRRLPKENQDRRCDYNSLDERLAIPQFSNFTDATPRADRFEIPKLSAEDYIRFDRMLDARGHRRKNFVPQRLSIYVDGVFKDSFNPIIQKEIRLIIDSEAGFVEVKGEDSAGMLDLAIVPMSSTSGFSGSVSHPGGRKVTVKLIPLQPNGSAASHAELMVIYTENKLTRSVSEFLRFLVPRSGQNHELEPIASGRSWLIPVSVLVTLLLLTLSLIWWQFSRSAVRQQVRLNEGTNQAVTPTQLPTKEPTDSLTPPTASTQKPTINKVTKVVARAGWNFDPQAALAAIPIEPTRSESPIVNLTRRETQLFLNLPQFDDQGRLFDRYQVTIFMAKRQAWQQILAAPKIRPGRQAHVLDLRIFSKELTEGECELHVNGAGQGGWQNLGRITLHLRMK